MDAVIKLVMFHQNLKHSLKHMKRMELWYQTIQDFKQRLVDPIGFG